MTAEKEHHAMDHVDTNYEALIQAIRNEGKDGNPHYDIDVWFQAKTGDGEDGHGFAACIAGFLARIKGWPAPKAAHVLEEDIGEIHQAGEEELGTMLGLSPLAAGTLFGASKWLSHPESAVRVLEKLREVRRGTSGDHPGLIKADVVSGAIQEAQ